MSGTSLGHAPSRGNAAGEDDFIGPRVDQRRGHLARALHDLQHVRRKAGGGETFGNELPAGWREFGGFQDDAIARDDGWNQLAERDRQGIVPRSDDTDDPAGLEAEPAGLGLDREIVVRDALVGEQLGSVARVVFRGLERNEDVGEERLDVRLACFVGYRCGQIEAARVKDFAEPPDSGATRRERLGRPKGLRTP